MSLRYRVSQFWKALASVPEADHLNGVDRYLTPKLMDLFMKMQPNEQAHSLHIFRQLLAEGEESRDLLTAALLHDVGKSRFPLRLWERVLVVLGHTLAPSWVERWGEGEPVGWKRPFVVAAKHPKWGAELACQAGASALAVSLIRRHQASSHKDDTLEDGLLERLQRADNEH